MRDPIDATASACGRLFELAGPCGLRKFQSQIFVRNCRLIVQKPLGAEARSLTICAAETSHVRSRVHRIRAPARVVRRSRAAHGRRRASRSALSGRRRLPARGTRRSRCSAAITSAVAARGGAVRARHGGRERGPFRDRRRLHRADAGRVRADAVRRTRCARAAAGGAGARARDAPAIARAAGRRSAASSAAPGNSWFALGPALVLALAHDHSPDGRWGVLVLALLAQGRVRYRARAPCGNACAAG